MFDEFLQGREYASNTRQGLARVRGVQSPCNVDSAKVLSAARLALTTMLSRPIPNDVPALPHGVDWGPAMTRRLSATAPVGTFSSHFAVVDGQQLQLFMLLALCLAALFNCCTLMLVHCSSPWWSVSDTRQPPDDHQNGGERLARGLSPRRVDVYGR